MGSPITLSGFNNIDFNLILNAIMEQERVPVVALEADRTILEGQDFEYGILATMLADLQSAAGQLASPNAFGTRAIATSDAEAVSASVNDSTPFGTYDVVVQELARSQVLTSTTTYADADTTVVASGGSLTIGGVAVTVSGDVTLQGLADTINGTAGITVTASAIATGPSTYRLMLTGNDTGAANGFTVTNLLTGGSGLTLPDFDSDGESGDDPADNAVSATDAAATVNNIAITSATNTIEGAVPGSTLTLLRKDPATTVTLTVTRDDQALKTKLDEFVTAYNSFIGYADAQFASAAEGTATSIGQDGLLRGLRTAIRTTVSQAFAVGGTYSYLAEVGVGSTTSGELQVDATLLDDALAANFTDVENLFIGAGGVDGAFTSVESVITAYTDAGGLIPDVRARIDDQLSAIDDRIIRLEEQLAVRRASLEAEFIAADLAISQLNAQMASLNDLGSQYRLF